VTSARTARTLALLIVALVVGLTIRYNTFAAWATDSGAYISAGQAWARGELFDPATFVFWAPWSSGGQVEYPLGHVQGPHVGTITGQYPLGYPVLIGAAIKIAGGDRLAGHLVSPILAGLLVWCAFLLGRAMVTPWAGVLTALLIGATPVVLGHTVVPFSDVPAAAFWALAWVMSLRPGYGAPMAAGAAAAMAVMIRPNLAPLAIVLALTVIVAERGNLWRRGGRLLAFGLLGSVGPLFVLWSQAALYGDPMQSGYRVPMDFFFKLERVPYNAGLYPRMLAELHSWVAFAGLAYLPFALRVRESNEADRMRAVIAASAVGIILVNYALYLPYLTYVGWFWLRFLLPALLAMFLLLAAGADHLRLWLHPRWGWAGALAFVPVIFVGWSAEEHIVPPVGYERLQLMEHYLPSVLPDNSVILTYAHGGALAAATGRPVVRIDYVEGNALDRVVTDLERRGYRPVYVFDLAVEADFVSDRFKSQRLGRLTWPARAELASVTSIVYYDLRDRHAFFSGDRWNTDILTAGRSVKGNVVWSDMRVEHERIILPLPQETAEFRTVLEGVYRDRLGRAATPTAINPVDAMTWMRRYLRFRLHGCSHDSAMSRVWQQIADGIPQPLCARPDDVSVPAENETTDFRQQLETRWSRKPGPQVLTAVDALGEAVWTQRYVDWRLRGCAHPQAIRAVTQRIVGEAVTACD
jgi:hypothetical protein